jgi:phenylalanyl-tRNA synthetase beta chain
MQRNDLPKSRCVLNPGKVVVGRLESIEKHPNAGNLRVAQVDVGYKKLQIVFGGPEIESVGAIVAVALPGAITAQGKLRRRKYRGVVSEAMICSAIELGLVEDGPDEILIIDENSQ